jgi:calmodulin
MASAAARERYARKNEADDLKRAFAALDKKGDGKVDPEELNQVGRTTV